MLRRLDMTKESDLGTASCHASSSVSSAPTSPAGSRPTAFFEADPLALDDRPRCHGSGGCAQRAGLSRLLRTVGVPRSLKSSGHRARTVLVGEPGRVGAEETEERLIGR